jgi:hypothetical protein
MRHWELIKFPIEDFPVTWQLILILKIRYYEKLAETRASDSTRREGALLAILPTKNGLNIRSINNWKTIKMQSNS